MIEERRRRKWSQQELADHIGTTQNNISRWELGITNPSPYFRTKLCDLFEASASDLGLLPIEATGENSAFSQPEEEHNLQEERPAEAASGAAVPETSCLWLIPYRRNPWFTGQETALARLAHLLPDTAEPLALCGMGGIGKTQLALEYAYRHALEYNAVFWIGAETAENTISSLLDIAEALHLPERDDKDQQRVIAAVQHWLNAHSQWLLIWDNAEDLTLFDRFLPATLAGTILLTTRYRVLGTLARSIDLLPMKQEEGVLFLLRRAKVLAPEASHEEVDQFAKQHPAHHAAAMNLVETLGGLPLALDQAGAYLEKTQCGLSAYFDLFCTQHTALLQQRGEGAHDHPASVTTTFTLAFREATGRYPAVLDLLRVCSLLPPDAIPEEVFLQGAEHLGAQLQTVCCDPLEWDQVVGAACSSSLLHRQPEERMFSMHRLVQAVLLDTMKEGEREQWNERVCEALNMAFPEVQPTTASTTWEQAERLLPPALLCLRRMGTEKESLPLASFAYKVGQYLSQRGEYAQAEPLLLQALATREHLLGRDHADVTHPLNSLAVLYWNQGKYTQAEPLYQRILSILSQSLEPDHPEMARPLNNLAILYWKQGNYAEAEAFCQRALRIWEESDGSNQLKVTSALDNLAGLHYEQGRYLPAEPLLRRALAIREHALGPDHPLVAFSVNNLAELYQAQGKMTQAEELYRRAIALRERVLRPDHPNIAASLTGLANLYCQQGKYAQAELLLRRALQIWEQALGPEHPNVAYPLNGLANLSRDRSRYPEAEQLYQRALLLREQHLGQRHPDTAQTLHDLAILRQKQGHLSEAISLAQRALSIRSQVLGEAHPQTIATRTLYNQLI